MRLMLYSDSDTLLETVFDNISDAMQVISSMFVHIVIVKLMDLVFKILSFKISVCSL